MPETVLVEVFDAAAEAALDETAACTNADVLAMLDAGIAEAVSGAETVDVTASASDGTIETSDKVLEIDAVVDCEG